MIVCSECRKKMKSGYVIEDGEEYYCCEKCLHKHYTNKEYLKMYDEGDGYWTEWENDDEV